MHTLLAAGGGAAVGGATNIYGYNREAWMTDVQVTQTRNYQKQQIMLSQVEMFREDIRDLVGSSVTRQNNYVILMTLVLGMIATSYVEGPLPKEAAEYLKATYHVCVSGALVFLVLAVLCAVGASNLAVICQRDMLTSQVRLPIDSMMEEIERFSKTEKVEAFENQGLKTVFRIPGVGRFKGHKRLKLKDGDSSDASEPHISFSTSEAMNSVRDKHLRAYYNKEREWRDLDKYAIVFGAAGLSNLLQAYAYFAAAKAYQGYQLGHSEWSSLVSQFLMTLIDQILTMAFNRSMQVPHRVYWTEATLLLTAQISCFLAIHADRLIVDQICIPLTFFCHVVANITGLYKLLKQSPEEEAAAREERGFRRRAKARVVRFATSSASSMDSLDDSDDDMDMDSSSDAGDEPDSPEDTMGNLYSCKSHRSRYKPVKLPNQNKKFLLGSCLSLHRTLMLGNITVLMAWTGCLIWSIIIAVRGHPDSFSALANVHHGPVNHPARPLFARRLSDGEAEFLDVAWPSPHFEPTALSCLAAPSDNGEQRCLLASKFLVFELRLNPGHAPKMTQLDCAASRTILDVVASCPIDMPCADRVLTSQPTGAVHVEDCAAGVRPHVVERVVGASAITGLRMAAAGEDALFMTQGQQILEHRLHGALPDDLWPPAARDLAWRPLWAVAEAPWESAFALDARHFEVTAADTSATASRALGGADNAGVVESEAPSPQPLPKRHLLVIVSERGAVEVHDLAARRRCGAWTPPALQGLRPLAVSWLSTPGSLLVLARAPDASGAAAARLARLQLPGFTSNCGVGAA